MAEEFSEDGLTMLRRADGTVTAEGSAEMQRRRVERARENRAREAALSAGAKVRADLWPRGELAEHAFAAAAKIAAGILTGEYGLRNGREAAQVMKDLVHVGRLENAQPTDIPGARESGEERDETIERLQRMQEELGQRAEEKLRTETEMVGTRDAAADD
ncbi:MAG: hypothetical protein GY795_11405 [Desulfobacterales bacterium]|nr:hypothetical protein [Desulfobacterales bacterium]